MVRTKPATSTTHVEDRLGLLMDDMVHRGVPVWEGDAQFLSAPVVHVLAFGVTSFF